MPGHVVQTKTTRGLGDSDTSTLEQMFPANPLPTYEPEVLMQSILDGNTSGNPDFGVPVNMDFDQAPVLDDPQGLVDQPFAFQPNIGSTVPGSINPSDKTDPPDTQPLSPSGMGSTDAPADSAAAISKQRIGEYIFGSSDPA